MKITPTVTARARARVRACVRACVRVCVCVCTMQEQTAEVKNPSSDKAEEGWGQLVY